MMTREEAINILKGLEDSGDTQVSHEQADDVLCSLLKALGFYDVVMVYRALDKWYS